MSRVAPDGLAWSLRHRRRVMEQPTRFIGMDVHKDTIVVAVTATGDVGKATACGTIPNTAAALEKLANRLHQAGSGSLQDGYQAWLATLPENLAGSTTADALRLICDLDLEELASVEPPRGFGRD